MHDRRGGLGFAVIVALLVIVVLGGCVSGPSGQAGDGQVSATKRSELRVGVSADYPPVIFERDGEYVGIEADLARRLGETRGWRISFVQLEFEDLIPALQEGRIDVIMSGMSVTELRSERVLFTEPYLRTGQMALIREADIIRLGSPRSVYFTTARVGSVRGTTGEAFVHRKLRMAEPVTLESPEQGVAMLRGGQIDIFIHDAPTIWWITSQPQHGDLVGLYWLLTEEYLAWAVRKDAQSLADDLNAALTTWRKSGQLQTILNRWMEVQVPIAPPA
jgi:ABC-type amino acid transport substrate-binding protein